MKQNQAKLLVIGAGIIGLTTAVRLLEEGYTDVTIISKDDPLKTNSDVAAALWRPFKGYPEDQFLALCNASLVKFDELTKIKESGVRWTTLVDIYPENQQLTRPSWMEKLSIIDIPPKLEHLHNRYPNIYASISPLVNSRIYRPFLLAMYKQLGGKIEKNTVENLEQLTQGNIQAVINCAGEQARILANDQETHAVRGQMLRVKLPKNFGPKFHILCENPLSFIIFREQTHDWIIGATYQENDYEENPRPEDTQYLLENADILWPGTKEKAEILETLVGFRCGRSSLRLAAEISKNNKDCIIVHNYGHGGGGYTASWGCADSVVQYCNEFIKKL